MKGLRGTEKQIKWAEKIRNTFMCETETFRKRYEKWSADEKRSPKFRQQNREKLQVVLDAQKVLENDEAKWWIENREGKANIPALLNRMGGK